MRKPLKSSHGTCRTAHGFGMLETMLAASVFAICIIAAATAFSSHFRNYRQTRELSSINQMERAVIDRVNGILQDYFNRLANPANACTPSMVAPLPLHFNLVGAISVRLIGQTEAADLTGQIASSARGMGGEELRQALTRCGRSRATSSDAAYFQSNQGLYVCYHFSGAGVTQAQPVIGEFYYTNFLLDAATPISPLAPAPPPPQLIPFGPISCAQFRLIQSAGVGLVRPTTGLLYYTLWWGSSSPSSILYQKKTGVKYLEN